nr:hypothetical protein Iba_chr15fCG4860 [Ipomoea batatas]
MIKEGEKHYFAAGATPWLGARILAPPLTPLGENKAPPCLGKSASDPPLAEKTHFSEPPLMVSENPLLAPKTPTDEYPLFSSTRDPFSLSGDSEPGNPSLSSVAFMFKPLAFLSLSTEETQLFSEFSIEGTSDKPM